MTEQERLKRIEERIEMLRDKAIRALVKVGLNPDSITPENGLFKRMEKTEQDIAMLKKALEGNVTIKTLRSWVLSISAVMGALMFLGGIFLKILK